MGIGMVGRALTGRFDVLHIHWFERAFWAPSKARVLRQVAQVLAVSLLLKLRGTRVVWTAHDPEPHQSAFNHAVLNGWSRQLWRLYRAIMLSLLDGILLLSASHASSVKRLSTRLASLPIAVVPHPHYLSQYPDTTNKSEARNRLGLNEKGAVVAFIGALRFYKNPDGLISAFQKMAGDATLLIAGAPETPEFAAQLTRQAEADNRVRLQLAFVPDNEIQFWLRASDLVVIPYKEVTNSGSAHLALSFDVPVLVPDLPVFRELEDLVGTLWVRRFSQDLAAEDISSAIAWAHRPRGGNPDLSTLSWERTALRTRAFYEQIISKHAPA